MPDAIVQLRVQLQVIFWSDSSSYYRSFQRQQQPILGQLDKELSHHLSESGKDKIGQILITLCYVTTSIGLYDPSVLYNDF